MLPKLRVMHSLPRRVEELEKVALVIKRDREAIEHRAIWELTPDQLELLFSAIGAEKQGRPLSAAESAAREAYTQAVEAESRSSPLSSNRMFKPGFDLGKGVARMVIETLSYGEMQLLERGLKAQNEGRVPTDAELKAMQATHSLHKRLLQLAGSSPEREDREGEE